MTCSFAPGTSLQIYHSPSLSNNGMRTIGTVGTLFMIAVNNTCQGKMEFGTNSSRMCDC
jgi:hypothetical protein